MKFNKRNISIDEKSDSRGCTMYVVKFCEMSRPAVAIILIHVATKVKAAAKCEEGLCDIELALFLTLCSCHSSRLKI